MQSYNALQNNRKRRREKSPTPVSSSPPPRKRVRLSRSTSSTPSTSSSVASSTTTNNQKPKSKKNKRSKRHYNKRQRGNRKPINPRLIEKHDHGKCHLCKGTGVGWICPTVDCTQCGKKYHDWCDPVLAFYARDNFKDIPLDPNKINEYHYTCQQAIAPHYKCVECSQSQWNELHKAFERPNGDLVQSYRTEINRKKKKIILKEKLIDGRIVSKEYDIRKRVREKGDERLHLEKIPIEKEGDPHYARKRFVNEELYHQSRLAYKDMTRDPLEQCPVSDPKYFMWVFKGSDVPTGVITVEGGFSCQEMLTIKEKMSFAHYNLRDPQNASQELKDLKAKDDDGGVDFEPMTETQWGKYRVKIEAGFKYSYKGKKKKGKGNRKQGPKLHKLRRSRIQVEDIPVSKFMDLRMRALFKQQQQPFKQHQYNVYNDLSGISQHPDELCWFGGAPVYTLRTYGCADLHFGLRYSNKAAHANLKVPAAAGTILVMGGIFQARFKHGIPKTAIYQARQTSTYILRDVHEESLNKWVWIQ